MRPRCWSYEQYLTIPGHPSDPRWIKFTVAFVLIVYTLNSVLDTWFAYHYSVSELGNPEAIYIVSWVMFIGPALTVIISSTVQSFFAWRIRKLTGYNWLAAIIIILAIAQLFAGIGTSIGSAILKDIHTHRLKSIAVVWFVLAPLDDFIIAASLAWFLVRSFLPKFKRSPGHCFSHVALT